MTRAASIVTRRQIPAGHETARVKIFSNFANRRSFLSHHG